MSLAVQKSSLQIITKDHQKDRENKRYNLKRIIRLVKDEHNFLLQKGKVTLDCQEKKFALDQLNVMLEIVEILAHKLK